VHQVKLLHRFTPNIVLLYDGDAAGIHAAMRGTDMLLEEGMHVKVLLLPDGDDPDSFARKHTAPQFKEYIEAHQTDFIQFKTELLLKGVTDPQKRSEAIGNILQSVSVIPDMLQRNTYITECAHRFNVREDALVSTVNRYIEKRREDRQKERDRAQAAGAGAAAAAEVAADAAPPAAADAIEPIGLHSALEQTTEVERLLVQNIIRHGEEVIFDNLEAEDGSTVSLNVAQYVDFDLGSDNLSFSDPLYNRILQEAVAHSADEGFKAEQYFMQHPDPQVSQLAAQLGIDSHQLSRSFVMKSSGQSLRQRIQHLILDFRMDIVNQHLRELQRQFKDPAVSADHERLKALMDDFRDTQGLRNALARQRGTDVIIS